MYLQSAFMAKGFGEFFQYGKRKISAMSNEEFNALSADELLRDNFRIMKTAIPSMNQAMGDMNPLVDKILNEMKSYFSKATEQGITGAGTVLENLFRGFGQVPAGLASTQGGFSDEQLQGLSGLFGPLLGSLPQAFAEQVPIAGQTREQQNAQVQLQNYLKTFLNQQQSGPALGQTRAQILAKQNRQRFEEEKAHAKFQPAELHWFGVLKEVQEEQMQLNADKNFFATKRPGEVPQFKTKFLKARFMARIVARLNQLAPTYNKAVSWITKNSSMTRYAVWYNQ